MKQSVYKSLDPVDEGRVRDELHKQNRLLDAHNRKATSLRIDMKEEQDKADKAMQSLRELLKADDDGTAVYELKNGQLTTEAPDAQTDLPGTG